MKTKEMKTKPLTFLFALTFMFLFSGSSVVFGGDIEKGYKAMRQDLQAQIELLGQALDLYRLEKHKYPSTDEGLKAIASYLKKEVPKDPWGSTYVYISPGEHGDYDLISYGADNAEGGEENNKDIVSWK